MSPVYQAPESTALTWLLLDRQSDKCNLFSKRALDVSCFIKFVITLMMGGGSVNPVSGVFSLPYEKMATNK